MTTNIHELTKSLREAADIIEKSVRFSFSEDIEIPDVVSILRTFKKKHDDITLAITITIDDGCDEVKFSINEGYKTIASAGTLKNCLEVFLATKEGADSLASVARLVKKACAIPEKVETAVATDAVIS